AHDHGRTRQAVAPWTCAPRLLHGGRTSRVVLRSLRTSRTLLVNELQAPRERGGSPRDVDAIFATTARTGEDARARRAVDLPGSRSDRARVGLADVGQLSDDEHASLQADAPDAGVRPASRSARLHAAILRYRDRHGCVSEPLDRAGSGVDQLEDS